MRKSKIKEYLRAQGIERYTVGQVKKLINCPRELIYLDPFEVGKVYKIPGKDEYYLCVHSSKYNTLVRQIIMED